VTATSNKRQSVTASMQTTHVAVRCAIAHCTATHPTRIGMATEQFHIRLQSLFDVRSYTCWRRPGIPVTSLWTSHRFDAVGLPVNYHRWDSLYSCFNRSIYQEPVSGRPTLNGASKAIDKWTDHGKKSRRSGNKI